MNDLPKIKVSTIIETYQRLKSLRAAARELEMPHTTIAYWLKRSKIKTVTHKKRVIIDDK